MDDKKRAPPPLPSKPPLPPHYEQNQAKLEQQQQQQQQQQQPTHQSKEGSSEGSYSPSGTFSSNSVDSASAEKTLTCLVCKLNLRLSDKDVIPLGSRAKHLHCILKCRLCKQDIQLSGSCVPLVLKKNSVFHKACREQDRERKKLVDPADRAAQQEIAAAFNAAARAAEADLRARRDKVLIRQMSHKSMAKFASQFGGGQLKFKICVLGSTTSSFIQRRISNTFVDNETAAITAANNTAGGADLVASDVEKRFSLRMRLGDRPSANGSFPCNEPSEDGSTLDVDGARNSVLGVVGATSMSDVVSGAKTNYIFNLSLLDTGSNVYADCRERWINESDAFIICYAVDNEQSFSRAQEMREDVLKANDYRFVPIVLAASKVDLPTKLWSISKQEGEELAAYYRCPFVEVSPKTGAGVFEAFDILCEQLQQLVDSVSAPTNHHTGWLRKRGHVRKNWKRRWFVLTGTSIRYYSKKTLTDVTALKGVIPLRGCKLLARGSKELQEAKRGVRKSERSHLLVLKLENGTDYFLLAESESDYDEWAAHIEMLISHAELRAEGGGSFASSVSMLSPKSSFIAESDNAGLVPGRSNISQMSLSSETFHATLPTEKEESFLWTPVKAKPETERRTTILRPSWSGAEEDERKRSNSTLEFVRNIHIGASRPSVHSSSLDRLAETEAAARKSEMERAKIASENATEIERLKALDPADALQLACKTFNKNPRNGITILLQAGAVGRMPEAIANFLLQGTAESTDPLEASSIPASLTLPVGTAVRKKQHNADNAPVRLYRTKVGEYLGEPGNFEVSVVRAYVRLFAFAGLSIDAALRTFLEKFRLPGEAQKIDRIMEAFAEWYCEVTSYGDGVFRSSDAAYILAFSLIMLNTDAHNDSVKNKMTKEQFRNNNRGINGGEDLPPRFLDDLFDAIITNEIVLESDAAERDDIRSWEKQGWLEVKMGGSWYKKFCILAANCLYMFERPTSSDPPELILPLMNVLVDDSEGELLILRAADRSKLRARKGNREIFLEKVSLRPGANQFRVRFEWLMRLRLNIAASPTYQSLGAKTASNSSSPADHNQRKAKSPYGRLPFVRP